MRFLPILFLLFSFVLLSACNEAFNASKDLNDNKKSFERTFAEEIHYLNSEKKINVTGSDSIPFDTLFFPDERIVMPIDILYSGQFHGDEVNPQASKQKWMGLFQNGNEYYLASTNIQTKRVHDELFPDDPSVMGWEISVKHTDSCLFLFEDLGFIPSHSVSLLNIDSDPLMPGDTIPIDFNGNTYFYYATGKIYTDSTNSNKFNIRDYRVFLSKVENGENKVDLIFADPYRFESYPISAGDFDGDGELDLIVNIGLHYNNFVPALYLSKYAEPGQLVKIMGMGSFTGC